MVGSDGVVCIGVIVVVGIIIIIIRCGESWFTFCSGEQFRKSKRIGHEDMAYSLAFKSGFS